MKNQQGQGVPGENIKIRILNITVNEVAIGRLSDFNDRTDASGFVHVTYTAPDTSELLGATSVVIEAILTNASYPREVTDHHEIELQGAGPSPGDCSSGGLVPQGEIQVSPTDPVVNQTVCFNATEAFPTAVEFTWDFNGDGTPDATGATACTSFSSVGTFQVTVLARTLDHDCGTATTVVTVGPGEPATCSIVASPTQVRIGDPVNFTAIVSDPDGRVRRFQWNFGDGESASSSRNTITHSYDSAGTFAVLLTITDDQGNVSTCQTSITVSAEEEGDPICSFTISPIDIQVGTTVNVNASTSTDDGEIVNYNVDFGDGTPPIDSADPIISKVGGYSAPGTYTITLTVTDDEGNSSVCSNNVTVTSPTPTPGQCNDGTDNDGDGLSDFPADPGCTSSTDPSEKEAGLACDNGLDDDGTGTIDFPADPGCTSPADTSETGVTQCDDDIDNDVDGFTDFPADPQCTNESDNDETI